VRHDRPSILRSGCPESHLVTAARELTSSGGTGPEVWWALLSAVVIVAVFAPLTVRAYKRQE